MAMYSNVSFLFGNKDQFRIRSHSLVTLCDFSLKYSELLEDLNGKNRESYESLTTLVVVRVLSDLSLLPL